MSTITGTAIDTIVGDEIAEAGAWARRIGGAWQKSIDAIFETGRLLIEAKASMPHGAFTAMIASDLPFGERAAQMLMKVAGDARLTDAKHASALPPSWMTLYELTKLDTPTFERRIKEGTIRPDMQRRDVATGGARSIMASREQAKASLDYFPTPPWATRALMNDVLPHLGVDMSHVRIWEPACGEGHMSSVLAEYCDDVLASDIDSYRKEDRLPPAWVGKLDFLSPDLRQPQPGADWIITNPPFGDLTLPFVRTALSLAGQGVAMFVRQQWLEGIERYEGLFRDRPPTLYAQFAERVNLCEGKWDPYGSTATAYCWLVWVKDMAPQPVFWIPPGRRVAYFRADDVQRFTAHPVLPPPARAAELEPFRSSEQVDQIIAEGYAGDTVDFDAIGRRLADACGIAASKLQIRRRANQLNLGSRDRQREVARGLMEKINAGRGV